jgi:hypothetical protein
MIISRVLTFSSHRRDYIVSNGLLRLWESVLERMGQTAETAFQRDSLRLRILVQDLLGSAVEWHTVPRPTNFLTFA